MAEKAIITEIDGKKTSEMFDLSTMDKASLRAMAELLMPLYNTGIQERNLQDIEVTDDEKRVKTMPMREFIDQAVHKYTHIARRECFSELLGMEFPLVEACKKQTFATIRISDKVVGDEKIQVSDITDTDKDIDILALFKESKNGIGANTKWVHMLQKLNYLMAIKVGRDIGDKTWDKDNLKNINDSFMMSDIAKSLDFEPGKSKDPLSNNQILKTIDGIVKAMIGDEYKAISHDIGYLSHAYARKDRKANTIQLPNHKTFAILMRDICHNAITGDGYTAESRCIKKSK